jgi:hypothetical protein
MSVYVREAEGYHRAIPPLGMRHDVSGEVGQYLYRET